MSDCVWCVYVVCVIVCDHMCAIVCCVWCVCVVCDMCVVCVLYAHVVSLCVLYACVVRMCVSMFLFFHPGISLRLSWSQLPGPDAHPLDTGASFGFSHSSLQPHLTLPGSALPSTIQSSADS